jgi:predicted ferric reductase
MPVTPIAVLGWLLLYSLLALLPMALAMGIERPAPRGLLIEVGAMLGLLGLGMLATQLVITGRHRWFAAGVGQDNLLQFHRRTGTLAWGLILTHPLLLFIGDPDLLAWLDPRVDLLRAGALFVLVLALTLLVLSSLWRETFGLQYETWRTIHAGLALIVVAGGLGHALVASHHTGGLATQWAIGLVIAVPLALLLETRLWRPWRQRGRPWRVVEVEPRRAESTRLVLEADDHPGMEFKAGQFAWLTLGETPFSLQQHPFSMTSSPTRPRKIEFIIKQSGDFTRRVAEVKPGTTAFLEGPYGVFSMPEDADRRAVFIAGGIGITPVLSMLRARRERGHEAPLWLLYANESEDQIVMWEAIEELADTLPLTRVHVLAEPSDDWDGETGLIDAELLDRHLPEDDGDIDYFVCGPPPMMDQVEADLEARGVPLLRLYSERFDLV